MRRDPDNEAEKFMFSLGLQIPTIVHKPLKEMAAEIDRPMVTVARIILWMASAVGLRARRVRAFYGHPSGFSDLHTVHHRDLGMGPFKASHREAIQSFCDESGCQIIRCQRRIREDETGGTTHAQQ